MYSATSKTPPCFLGLTSTLTSPHPRPIQFIPRKETQRIKLLESSKCAHNSVIDLNSTRNTQNPSFPLSSGAASQAETPTVTGNKLQRLVSEFKSLPEPIERVKRLLHYADVLPPFDDSCGVEANRVKGCTTQVWLEVKMDSRGLMRFRAYSDSELIKGFCSCLISVLDGAVPEEVLAVEADDLADMNVGFSGRAQSRVNTWHNILMSMQRRTEALVQERKKEPSLEPFAVLHL